MYPAIASPVSPIILTSSYTPKKIIFEQNRRYTIQTKTKSNHQLRAYILINPIHSEVKRCCEDSEIQSTQTTLVVRTTFKKIIKIKNIYSYVINVRFMNITFIYIRWEFSTQLSKKQNAKEEIDRLKILCKRNQKSVKVTIMKIEKFSQFQNRKKMILFG